MDSVNEEDPDERMICDWCEKAEGNGACFVPGKGILNLCENCQMMLRAVIIDLA